MGSVFRFLHAMALGVALAVSFLPATRQNDQRHPIDRLIRYYYFTSTRQDGKLGACVKGLSV